MLVLILLTDIDPHLLQEESKTCPRDSRAKYGDYDIKDSYKSIDFSIPLGLSYEISDFVIDARYNLGLSNIVDHSDDGKVKNGVIMLTLGYKIPF